MSFMVLRHSLVKIVTGIPSGNLASYRNHATLTVLLLGGE
jgi:alkylated DNA nucleotide flippase Atl1